MASKLPCLFIRNARKDYGTEKIHEGVVSENDRVVILEDVATTGGQVLEAAGDIEASGAVVTTIIAVVDREEGARRAVEDAGYSFDALFTVSDLGIDSAS